MSGQPLDESGHIAGRVVPALDGHGLHAHGLDRVIVAALVKPVTDEQEVVEPGVELLLQFPDPVGLVDAMAGHVDRGGTPAADLQVTQPGGDRVDQPALLGPVGIPGRLRLDRRGLAERREGDLTAAVLDDRAPRMFRPQPEPLRLLGESVDGAGLLVLRQILGINLGPLPTAPPVVAGAAGRHQVQPLQPIRGTQKRQHLGLELLEPAPGDDAHGHLVEQPQQQVGHRRIDGRLGRGQGVVQVEDDRLQFVSHR